MGAALTGWIGALASIVTIGITIFLYRAKNPVKTLDYDVVSDEEHEGGRRIITLHIINSGNQPIKPGDYSRPITVQWGDKMQLQDKAVIGAPQAIISAESIKYDHASHQITVDPLLLNPKEEFTVELDITDHGGTLHIWSHFDGQTRPMEQRSEPGHSSTGRHNLWLQKRKKVVLYGGGAAVALIAIGTFVLVDGKPPPSRTIPPNSKPCSWNPANTEFANSVLGNEQTTTCEFAEAVRGQYLNQPLRGTLVELKQVLALGPSSPMT